MLLRPEWFSQPVAIVAPDLSGRSKPSAHRSLVPQPFLTEGPFQLSLLAPNEEVHERQMNRRDDESHGRAQDQSGTEENEYVAAEVERVARVAVRARGQ